MNLNLILVVGVCAVLLWALVKALRTGEFNYFERSTSGLHRSPTRLRRDANPVGFWILAGGHAAAIIYIASYAFMP